MLFSKRLMRWLRITIGLLCALYLSACTALYLKQNQLLYHPSSVTPANQKASVAWPHDGQILRITQVVRTGQQAVIYLGGNAEDVRHTAIRLAELFPTHSIYAMNYRGYAGSTGEPNERALVGDALALFDKIHATHPHVQVMGRSLGSGVAVQLAHARPIERMVLVTPFDSIAAVAGAHYPYLPISMILKDTYRSVRYAPEIKIPVTVLVAGQDETIPPAHAHRLAQAFLPQWVTVVNFEGAGHNTISSQPDFWMHVVQGLSGTEQVNSEDTLCTGTDAMVHELDCMVRQDRKTTAKTLGQ